MVPRFDTFEVWLRYTLFYLWKVNSFIMLQGEGATLLHNTSCITSDDSSSTIHSKAISTSNIDDVVDYGTVQRSVNNLSINVKDPPVTSSTISSPSNNHNHDGQGKNDEESSVDNDSVHYHPQHKGTITMLGSIAIIANSLTGPAMVNLPSTFQQSGIIPTVFTIIFLGYLSCLGSLHMANAISKVPGNSSFTREIEFSESFRLFWGQTAFVVTQVVYFGCITCLNIASIVDTAQVVDQILSKRLGTWALKCTSHSLPSLMESSPHYITDLYSDENGNQMMTDGSTSGPTGSIDLASVSTSNEISAPSLAPTSSSSSSSWRIYRGNCEWIEWNTTVCEHENLDTDDDCIPFSDQYEETMAMDGAMMLLTVGYVLSAVVFIPMSLKDLKENTPYQIVSFIILLVLSVQFIVSFLMNGIDLSNVTLWGNEWKNLFGVVLFNLAAVIAIPAWLYEKKSSVSVCKAVNHSTVLSCGLYILIGALGALTMPNVSDNMLQSMMSGSFGHTTEITSEIFAFFIIGFGIPLFSVLSRLNLVGSGLCSESVANILSIYLPWLVSWAFYTGEKVSALLGWGGVVFTSIIVFLAPLLLALHARLEFDTDGSVPVYGTFFKSEQSQVIMLVILLLCSIASVVLAFIGEIMY